MFNYDELKNLLTDEHMCISIVGGGGKTSTMYALARLFANENKRVIVTTTTRIFAPTKEQSDGFFVENSLKNIYIPYGKVYGYGAGINEAKKVDGFDVTIIEEAENMESSVYDVLLCEADGAKRLPLKAPNKTEPCIANNSTHVIACLGLDSLGKKLNEDIAFRVDLISQITGCQRDDIIEPVHIKRLIKHENGLFQYTPNKAKKILLLTKADDSSRVEFAKQIKALLCEDNWLGDIIYI